MENQRIRIEIPEHKSKERIDTFLAREIAGVSRSQIQKAVKEGLITVNGKSIKVRHQVQPFEIVEIVITKSPPQDILSESIPLNIVFEDEHLIIVNKPAGMVVHPAYGHSSGTLVNALLGHAMRFQVSMIQHVPVLYIGLIKIHRVCLLLPNRMRCIVILPNNFSKNRFSGSIGRLFGE